MSAKICLDVQGLAGISPDEIYVYTTNATKEFTRKATDKMTIDGVDYNYFVADVGEITNPSKKIIKKGDGYHEEIEGISMQEYSGVWYAAQIADKDVLINDEKIEISNQIKTKNNVLEGNIIREKITYARLPKYARPIISKQHLETKNNPFPIFSYEEKEIEAGYINVTNLKKINDKYVGFFIVRYNYINAETGCFDVKVCTNGYVLNKYNNILKEINHLNDFYSQCVYLQSPSGHLEFIIMPKIEGTVKELWGSGEDNFCKIIKSIVSQAYCLYKLGYLYVDMRSKNILYRKDKDGNINIILEDLEHMLNTNEQHNLNELNYEYMPMDLWVRSAGKIYYGENLCKLVVWGIGIVILEFLGYNEKATEEKIYPTKNEVKLLLKGLNSEFDYSFKKQIADDFIKRHKSVSVYPDSLNSKTKEELELYYGYFIKYTVKLYHGIERLESLMEIKVYDQDALDDIIEQTEKKTTSENLKTLLRATLNPDPKERPTLEQLYHDFEFNP